MIDFSTLWNRIRRPSWSLTISAALFTIGLGASLSIYVLNRPTRTIPKTVRIESGATLGSIAARLKSERIIRSPGFLRVLAVVTGTGRQLTAGDHPFDGRMTAWDVLTELQVPRDVTTTVTIPEGLRKERVVEILSRDLGLDAAKLLSLIDDPTFCSERNVDTDNLEGYLFPETYHVSVTATEAQVLGILVDQFHRVFGPKLKADTRRMGMSVHEAVTMASIIEGEAQVDAERTTISAVYHNRIKKRMRLQADPTVQYAIPDGPRRLFNKDYQYASPYNTYRHRGLPPGPILSPGAASMNAAVNPADVGYLYFVAKGDGSHLFTTTAAEHEAAKRKTKAARRKLWKTTKRR
jgi:UPF0755 protein